MTPTPDLNQQFESLETIHDNMKPQRQAAFETFQQQTFPNRRVEQFKYSKLNEAHYLNYSHAKPQSKIKKVPKKSFDFKTLSIINGSVDLDSDLPQGLSLSSTKDQTAVPNNDLPFSTHTSSWNSLQFLNQAFHQDGYTLNVEKGTSLQEPFIIEHFTNSKGLAVHNQNKICVEENASLTVVEIYKSDEQQHNYLQNQVLDIECKQNAKLNFVRIQLDSKTATHHGCVDIKQGHDSTCNLFSIALGGQHSRLDLSSFLNGAGSHSALSGLYVGKDKQSHDHYTCIHHAHADTTSYELFKGVVDDQSVSSFTGKIIVAKDAQRVDSKQMNRNLILSKNATANSAPQLEIFADDVKCAHGSTVGELNEDEMFYLRSRGFSEMEAKRALLKAYTQEVLSQIKHADLETFIESKVLDHLEMG